MKKMLVIVIALVLAISTLAFLPTASAQEDYEYDYENGMTLYAGQDIPVGTVYVENDGNYLNVTYEISESGWYLTETHVHVGKELDDFPTAGRWGNPVPGQFDYKATFELEDEITEYTEMIDLGEWEAGDELLIAAHAVIEKEECEILEEAPYGGSRVVYSEQGLRYDYTDVRDQRSNPNATLTFNTGQNEENFFSLGFQEDRDEYLDTDDAWIINEFDYPILNGDGDDLQVIEDTWGLPYPNETADVWVSQDGEEWHYLGEANNQNPISQYHTITNFDLEDVGLDYANFVKVQDTSDREDFAHLYPGQSATLDGYDLNAVVALQDHKVCERYDETAWGDGTRFTNKGNWGTYFKYTVQGEIEEEWPEGGTTTVAFEDGNPDWDYNDWVADIETKATFWGTTDYHDELDSVEFTITPEARGAGYNHVFHMRFPADTFASDGEYTLTVYDENGDPMGGYPDTGVFDASIENDFVVIPDTTEALPGTLTNTIEPEGFDSHYNGQHEPYVPPQRTAKLTIEFDNLEPFDFTEYNPYSNFHGTGLFFDPYLYVINTDNEIHTGNPMMLTVPDDWMWPEAGVGIWEAYPDVTAGDPPTFEANWWENYNDLVYNGKP